MRGVFFLIWALVCPLSKAATPPPCPYDELLPASVQPTAKKNAYLESLLARSAQFDGSPTPLGSAITKARRVAEAALAKGTKTDQRLDAENFLEAVLFLDSLKDHIGAAKAETLAQMSEDPSLLLGFLAVGKVLRAEGPASPSQYAKPLEELADKAASLSPLAKLQGLLTIASTKPIVTAAAPAAGPAAAPVVASVPMRRAQAKLAEAAEPGQPAFLREDAQHFLEMARYVDGAEAELGADRGAALAKLMENPALDKAFVALGKARQTSTALLPKQAFDDILKVVAEYGPKLSHENALALIQSIARTAELRAKDYQSFEDWRTTALPGLLEKHTAKSREEFRARLITDLGISARDSILVTKAVSDTVFLFDSPGVRDTLRRFLGNNQLTHLPVRDQATLFYYLALARNRAESSVDPVRTELLNNTVDFILSGKIGVELTDLDPHTLGNASRDKFRLNRKYLPDPDTSIFNRRSDDPLETIGHEVSHIRSPAGVVAESVGYFEEEMRAWMVGFYMGKGRLPTKREAAEHAEFLLTYPEKDNSAYSSISREWKRDPASFANHLQQLGLGQATPDLKHFSALIAQVPVLEPAPRWGWPGFLVNAPAPPFISGKGLSPSPVAERFGATIPKLKADGVDPALIEQLRMAVGHFDYDERMTDSYAVAMQPARREIEKVSEQPDPKRAAEEALALFEASKQIAKEHHDLEEPHRVFLMRAIQDPRSRSALVDLGKAQRKWDTRPWMEAVETAALEIYRQDPERASQSFTAFARMMNQKADEAPADTKPKWTAADTQELLNGPAGAKSGFMRWLFPKKAGN